MDISNLPESILQTALRILTIFVGIFGSTVVGILGYFLSKLISKQEKVNEKLLNGQVEIEKEIISIKKDLEFIEKDSHRRPWKAPKFKTKKGS